LSTKAVAFLAALPACLIFAGAFLATDRAMIVLSNEYRDWAWALCSIRRLPAVKFQPKKRMSLPSCQAAVCNRGQARPAAVYTEG
jgi:hypothetical protein